MLLGCDKGKAPDFDGAESSLVLNACEAIAQGKDQEAMNVLNELRQYPSSASFVEEAQLATQRHHNSRQINYMLQAGDLKKLKQFLIEAEKQGILSSDMLMNSDVPDALQELMLFCAKMPWEHSTSLQNALSQLAPYVETLSNTEAFRAFYSEQLKLLKKMQNEELQAKINSCLNALDKAAATGDTRSWTLAHNDLHKIKSDSDFFKLELQLGSQLKTPNPDWSMYAIALVGNWKRLSAKQRKTALDAFEGKPSNICSNILYTMKINTSEAMLAHKNAMKELGLEPSNDAIVFFMDNLDIKYLEGSRTNSPGLGLNSIFALLSSLNIGPQTKR